MRFFGDFGVAAEAWRLGKFAASATTFTSSGVGALLSTCFLGEKELTSNSRTSSKILARSLVIKPSPPFEKQVHWSSASSQSRWQRGARWRWPQEYWRPDLDQAFPAFHRRQIELGKRRVH